MSFSERFMNGFEPGNLYASYAREQKGLDVQNCGWENFECIEKLEDFLGYLGKREYFL